VRDLRCRRSGGDPCGGRGGVAPHEPGAAPPGAGRGRLSRGAARGPGHVPAAGHRPFRWLPADDQRRPDDLARVQRRGVQLPPAARRVGGPRPPLPDPFGHRGDRARVRGLRRGLCPEAARDVCLRPVGRRAGAARARAGPARGQAPVLPATGLPNRIRVGAQGAAPASGRGAAAGATSPGPVPHVRVRPEPAHRVLRRPEAAAGSPAGLGTFRPEGGALLGLRPRGAGVQESAGVRGGAAGTATGGGAFPPGERRARGGLPQRRAGQQYGGRLDEPGGRSPRAGRSPSASGKLSSTSCPMRVRWRSGTERSTASWWWNPGWPGGCRSC
jgi:hypothetical protein